MGLTWHTPFLASSASPGLCSAASAQLPWRPAASFPPLLSQPPPHPVSAHHKHSLCNGRASLLPPCLGTLAGIQVAARLHVYKRVRVRDVSSVPGTWRDRPVPFWAQSAARALQNSLLTSCCSSADISLMIQLPSARSSSRMPRSGMSLSRTLQVHPLSTVPGRLISSEECSHTAHMHTETVHKGH